MNKRFYALFLVTILSFCILMPSIAWAKQYDIKIGQTISGSINDSGNGYEFELNGWTKIQLDISAATSSKGIDQDWDYDDDDNEIITTTTTKPIGKLYVEILRDYIEYGEWEYDVVKTWELDFESANKDKLEKLVSAKLDMGLYRVYVYDDQFANGLYNEEKWGETTYTIKTKNITVHATNISLKKNLSIRENQSIELKPKALAPSGALLSGVKWTSSNKKIAVVYNGLVTGVKPGKCTVTATLNNGKKFNCTVTVKKTVYTESVSRKLSDYYYGFYVLPSKAYYEGNSLKIDAVIINNRMLAYTLTSLTIVAYDEDGKIFAKQSFSPNIKVKAYSIANKTFTIKSSNVKNRLIDLGEGNIDVELTGEIK